MCERVNACVSGLLGNHQPSGPMGLRGNCRPSRVHARLTLAVCCPLVVIHVACIVCSSIKWAMTWVFLTKANLSRAHGPTVSLPPPLAYLSRGVGRRTRLRTYERSFDVDASVFLTSSCRSLEPTRRLVPSSAARACPNLGRQTVGRNAPRMVLTQVSKDIELLLLACGSAEGGVNYRPRPRLLGIAILAAVVSAGLSGRRLLPRHHTRSVRRSRPAPNPQPTDVEALTPTVPEHPHRPLSAAHSLPACLGLPSSPPGSSLPSLPYLPKANTWTLPSTTKTSSEGRVSLRTPSTLTEPSLRYARAVPSLPL